MRRIVASLVASVLPFGGLTGTALAADRPSDERLRETLAHASGAPAPRLGPVGWETYRHPERLAEIGNAARTRQFSSFDRGGGNNDGFEGTYSCLRTTASGGCVIAEHTGAGEIASIWFTRDGGDVSQTGTITIELDGRTVVDADLQDLVDGKLGEPFVYPLVANADQSSGGVYIKVPMPYRHSMRITTQHNPYFHHVTYREFASPEGIETFDPTDPATDVLAALRAAGTRDPKPDLPGERTTTRLIDVAPGETVTLGHATGPGAITELVLRLPQLQPSPTDEVVVSRRTAVAPSPVPGKARWVRPLARPAVTGAVADETEEILREARLRISVDGVRTVDAPLGEFFGSGFGLYPVRAYMFGVDPEQRTLSSWWLMPYSRAATVELYNGADVALNAGEARLTVARSATWKRDLEAGRIGYFRATAVRSEATFGRDHLFLDVTGRGRVVGVTHTVQGLNEAGWRRGYLEGDERVFVDGSTSPDLHGTGTEDFYEGGWYFNRGAFSAPLTGSPVPDRADCPAGCTSMYRLLLADGMDFASSMRFGIEHGPGNDEPVIESTTTYWYGVDHGGLVWTDHLDVGDAASEAAHDYRSPDPGAVESLTSRFEGLDGPPEPVTVDTRATSAPVSFTLAVHPGNHGVILRRVSDQAEGYQAAEVSVNGKPAGTWTQPLANPEQRLLDDYFWLPATLTAGRRTVTVTLRPLDGHAPWSAADYHALSIRSPYTDRDAPARVSGLTARGDERTAITLGWTVARDDVYAVTYEVHASTTKGFTPSDETLVGVARTPGFVHETGTVRQTWYYRVRAVDAAGHVGAFSSEVSATTGDTLRIEAESLLPPVEATAPVQVQGNCCGVVWSGNAQLWFTPTTSGQHVVVEVTLPTTGTYELTTRQTLARDYGINTLTLDGQPIGEAFDAYHFPEVVLSEALSYGTHHLTAGKHTLTIAVPDKNPASESYMAGFDYFQFQLVD
ncbi:DUF2961 domain-containing protein [Thermasporomyces composti]|jgi:hypothetical protein|uniref:DUF2961 family protein n=1 Tax=Thermasporomyces composti TaxID=696763 RepID=A0A3D9V8Y1_THECX|nr:DUF2961 domain-containing protein [Thermasporomyces composti]REF37939.1 DUF2961 family protein [Thermasporomyces composti]